VTAGQDGMIACHPYLNRGVWSDQSYQEKGTKEVPNSGTRSIKRAFSQVETTLQVAWPIQTIFMSLRVTQMLPTIGLEQ
jgi:hypothetical protein